MRSDVGITYDEDVLRLIDVFRERGFLVENVVMTQFDESNTLAVTFMQRLERMGIKVARHRVIAGYPANVDVIVSEEGLGKNDFVQTSRDLVVVTAPGPGSGKLATCLSQIYHEAKRGTKAGYAKFETFPIWNVALEHPVNLAYEAATVDLDDANLIDPFHLEAYGESVSSYNRDIDVFPLVRTMLERIAGQSPYQSPTDMGVNMAGYCISDDEAVREASRQEIIRRYYQARVEERKEALDTTLSDRVRHVMRKAGVTTADRNVVAPALKLAEETGSPASAIELPDGSIVTGKTSELLGCSAAMLLNALKQLAGIDREALLLSPQSIEPIQKLKVEHLGSRNPRLHTDEVLIALCVGWY